MRPHFSILAIAATLLTSACAPTVPQPHAPTIVPLRSLRLYETGVGYFERSGAVTGDQALPVPTSHLDDALKSLVILGPGAHVQGLTFASNMSRTMARSLVGLPEGSEELSYRDLLASLKGATVEIGLVKEGGRLTGRLVEVHEQEAAPAPTAKGGEKVAEGKASEGRKELVLVVLASGGELRKLRGEEVTGVRPLDPAFSERLGSALDVIAPRSAQTQRPLRLLGQSGAPVTFGYIAETPVWRTSYRLLLEDSSALLQGWALLHNDTDEDWKEVQLTLVNGRPDSFLFPLAAPRYLRRELVHPEQPLPTVPQLHGKGPDELWGDEFGAGGLGLSGVGEGGGGRGEGIGLGSVGTIGHGAGVGVGSSGLLSVGNLAGVAQAAGSEQGALFNYSVRGPLSLAAHGSALVPFLEQRLATRQITWIEDEGARAGVRFENTTGQTLPAGTIAFFSGGGFAGEATVERLKPGERRFLTFGADLDVELRDRRAQSRDEPQRVTSANDRLEEHFLRTTEHELTLENRSPSPRTVYLVLKLHKNAKVTGADALDYDTAQDKPVAIFELSAKQKVERKYTSVEGLSRAAGLDGLSPEQLEKLAQAPSLPAADRAALRELAARRAEQRDADLAIEQHRKEMAETEQELERLRKHLEALGSGNQGPRADANPFVKRILAAEDRLTDSRKRLDALQKQSNARKEASLAALRKLPR